MMRFGRVNNGVMVTFKANKGNAVDLVNYVQEKAGRSIETLSDEYLAALTTIALEKIDAIYNVKSEDITLEQAVYRHKLRESETILGHDILSLSQHELVEGLVDLQDKEAFDYNIMSEDTLFSFYLVHFKMKLKYNVDLERLVELIAKYADKKAAEKLKDALSDMTVAEQDTVFDLAENKLLNLFKEDDIEGVEELYNAREKAYYKSAYVAEFEDKRRKYFM